MSDDKIVSLVHRNVADVPAMMEGMAKEIRDGKAGNVLSGVAVFLSDEGDVTVCGWGRESDEIHSIGLLQLGVSALATNQCKR